MNNSRTNDKGVLGNPIDLVAKFVSRNHWYIFENNLNYVHAEIPGYWGIFDFLVNWKIKSEVMIINCYFDIILQKSSRNNKIENILTILNKNLVIGHFILEEQTGKIFLRYSLPLRGAGGATSEQIEDIIDIVIEQCEQAYPVLHSCSIGKDYKNFLSSLYFADAVGEA